MSTGEHLEKMKKIHETILLFLQDVSNQEENFQNLLNIFKDVKLHDDQHKLKLILHLLSKISNNHQRNANFFNKIEQIIQLFKDRIKKYFSNSEIFKIFKSNKRLLLFLIEEKIIIIDENIVKTITTCKYLKFKYPHYFKPEIRLFVNEEWFPKEVSNFLLPEYFYQKRRIGENDNYLCQLIQKDLLDEFIFYINNKEISFDSLIEPSIFETNTFLLKNENTTLIEYAAFFGSLQIIQYLAIMGIDLKSSLWLYSIHNQNTQLLHLLEENRIEPEDKTYKQCLKELIKCHHNDIIDLIKGKLNQNSFFTFLQSVKYFNFALIEGDLIYESASFNVLCKYDYYLLVDFLLKNKNIDVNQSNNVNESPYYLAVENENLDIINLLLASPKLDLSSFNINQIFERFIIYEI